MAPLTPTLDPIPDVYDEDFQLSPTKFNNLSLDDMIQMPQPKRTIPRYHSPSTMLNSNRPTTPNLVRAHTTPSGSSYLPTSNRAASPLRSPKRVRSPLRHASSEDIYTISSVPEISSISEDAELEITPRSRHGSSSSLSFTSNMTLNYPSLKRRAQSPHRSLRASSVPASPSLKPGRYNESFVPDLTYSRSFSLASSSVPSTPTSARSRSPSISSLETIPDTPDEEQLAAEEDNRDRDSRRRMWELYGTSTQASRGGFGSRDKRKRWSVCGAEKRSDLNLETIWED